jgi:hypothetical protein
MRCMRKLNKNKREAVSFGYRLALRLGLRLALRT